MTRRFPPACGRLLIKHATWRLVRATSTEKEADRLIHRIGGQLRKEANYRVRVVDGNDDPVVRLARKVKDCGRPAPMADREGNAVTVPDRANHDYSRKPVPMLVPRNSAIPSGTPHADY